MRGDELAHHSDTFSIVENDDPSTVLPEQMLGAFEVLILSDDDPWDTIKQRGARTHNAGTQSADKGQLRPVSPAACIAKADAFGVRCRISTLNSQIVPAGDDLPLRVGEDRTDGQAALAQSLLRLLESRLQ